MVRGARALGPRGLKETFGPASQAQMYLGRALEDYHHASNAPDLWVPAHALYRGSLLEGAQEVLTAKTRRLQFLRSAVLFAALAVEAYANELLADILPPRDWEALDQLKPPEKLLLGTRLAGEGESPLDRGAEPLQSVTELMKVRNRLVHARPQGGIAAWVQDVEEADERAIGPDAALNAILRVSETVVACNPLRPHPSLHGGIAQMIVWHAALVRAHNERGGPRILDVPARDAEGAAPLHDQMMDVVAANARAKAAEDARLAGQPRGGGNAEQVLGQAGAQGDEAGSAGGKVPQAAGEVED